MTSETLNVVLDRQRPNGADAPSSFTAAGSFTVALDNRGKAVHVHLRFRDQLADVAAVSARNQYVEEGETRRVHIDVPDVSEPVTDRLELVTGHGADGTGVNITLTPRQEPTNVDVDESLSRPPEGVESGDTTAGSVSSVGGGSSTLVERVDPPGADSLTLLVAGFALVALLLAVGAAVTLDSLVVSLGLVAVLISVGGALSVLFLG